jgi:hypothetical protein
VTGRPESGDQPAPRKRARPKRGAFPTPKSEIDEAEPYIPDGGEVDESRGAEDLSVDVDPEKGG